MKLRLQGFEPGNLALTFLEQRIFSDAYRGDVSSQHNRWTFDDLVFVLERLQRHQTGNSVLAIRTADKSKRPQNLSNEIDFAKFCGEVKLALGKGSQDAMRKNWFVDWHRAGWLDRYDAAMAPLAPFKKGQAAYVRLSSEGRKLIEADRSHLDRLFVFSKGIDALYSGVIGVLLELFLSHEIRYVDMHEFTFFVTAVGADESFERTPGQVADLIRAWRKLTPLARRQIDSHLAKELVPGDYAENKTGQRDYHNWINKSQQTFSLLRQTVYFDQVDHTFSHFNRLMYLGDSSPAAEGFSARDNKRLNRSLRQKQQYFEKHRVSKTRGFELHHIVALSWAESAMEFKALDDWRNMIYIDAYSHAKISQRGNKNFVLGSSSAVELKLADLLGDVVAVANPKQARYDIGHVPTMLSYNAQLIRGREA